MTLKSKVMPRSRKSRYADDYRTLLAMLIAERERKGINQTPLATAMGTSQSMLSKLERGVVRMDLIDLLAYCGGIHVDPVQFVQTYMKAIGWKAKAAR